MRTDPSDTSCLFVAAQRDAPRPALAARVLADAAAVQARAEAPGRAWWRETLAAMGGWPTVSGAVAAGAAGVAIGVFAPDLVDGLAGGRLTDLSGAWSAAPDLSALAQGGGDV